MKNKKGISAIVATVLIILITVAAITIIWAAIIPLISEQLETGTACLDAIQVVQISPTNTCVGDTPANVTLQVSHGAKDIDLEDIQVLVFSGGNSEAISVVADTSYTNSDLPNANENRVFEFLQADLTTTIGTIDQIAVAPVIGVGNTQQICEATAPADIDAC